MDLTYNQALFLSLSMVILVLYYGIIAIGWYFSTDYFDKYLNMLPFNGDAFFIFCAQTAIIIFDIIILAKNDWNLFSGLHMLICIVVWIVIIIPLLITAVIKSRKYLRKKRGKL